MCNGIHEDYEPHCRQYWSVMDYCLTTSEALKTHDSCVVDSCDLCANKPNCVLISVLLLVKSETENLLWLHHDDA